MVRPLDSPIIQALMNRGFKFCRAADGLEDLKAGRTKTVSADFTHRDLCVFPDFDNLPERVSNGAGHGVGIPWNEDVRRYLGLPEGFTLADDPGLERMNQWLAYLARGNTMAWKYLADHAARGHDLFIQVPDLIRPHNLVTAVIGGSSEIHRVTVRLPQRLIPFWPAPMLAKPRTPSEVIGREVVFETDEFTGEGEIVVSAVDPNGGLQAIRQVFVVQEAEEDPEPEPDPVPTPDPEPDPDPEPPVEPDPDPEACNLVTEALDRLEQARQILCTGD